MNIFSAKSFLSTLIVAGCITFLPACSPQSSQQADKPVESSEKSKPQVETGNQELSTAANFEAILQDRIEDGRAVGLAIAIIDAGNEDHITIGHANAEDDQFITKESIFEIGSITKTFTTLMLADMVIKGEVKLDDPVSKYLPETVKVPSYKTDSITLKHLAMHTSSLPRMPDNFNPADPTNPYADYTPELLYAFLSGYSLERPIGEKVEYSNLGVGLLGHILELHSGMGYEELVTAQILTPLGMNNTFMEIPENKRKVFTTGYDAAGSPTSHWDIATLSGAGALRSDITDMTIYLKANMGLIDTPLKEAMEMVHKLQQEDEAIGGYVGLGWLTDTNQKNPITWHNGGTGGYTSYLGFNKEIGKGVVVLANSQGTADLIAGAILKDEPDMLIPDQENTDISFSEDELERFVGDYQLAPNFIISITRNGTNLFAQATGQSKFPIFAKSKTEFFLKVVEASVIFKENEAGEITSLVLNQNGMQQPAAKQ